MFQKIFNCSRLGIFTSLIPQRVQPQPSTGAFQGLVPARSTFILKRKYPLKLSREGSVDPPRLKGRHYVYDLVENSENVAQPKIQVVLNKNIPGLGNSGDCVTVKKNFAYNKLLLPGLASYATPENIENAKTKSSKTDDNFSSKTAPLVVDYLKNQVLLVLMNKENEWTLQPWHVRVAFRKAGFNVPEYAIKLPEKEINGPDLNIEQKEFIVMVKVNGKEESPVRCRIHHWSTHLVDRLPHIKSHWTLETEPIFEEQRTQLISMPLPKCKLPPDSPQ